ncbi:hypothetical protein [Psychroflexus aestuariivivens]|uniref:hypothetical protein n=1 Tax=Psychroflexus aestuariivivens TaxID=1795040 RepID=UPI000FDABA0B|nr:hypothetical protein [Psychroflexus aestuariivivens]
MKPWLFIILVCFGISCQNADLKKRSAQDILESEMQQMNWEEVDFYPTFSSCSDVTSKTESLNCFKTTVETSIIQGLKNKNLIRSNPEADTLRLHLYVDQFGNTQITNIDISETTAMKNPELRFWLQQSIQNLPKAYPAQKRSVPVNLKVKLPIILK